ncbi:MAG TPA: hypothetical protein VK745_32305, partial [Polyangiaceae bacterium]|nr:hypothetical protein [Polyangiaceae bacterium]
LCSVAALCWATSLLSVQGCGNSGGGTAGAGGDGTATSQAGEAGDGTSSGDAGDAATTGGSGCFTDRAQASRIALVGTSACAIDSTGSVQCWGAGDTGTGPAPMPPTETFLQVSAQLGVYAAVTTAHEPLFWGGPQPSAATPLGMFDQATVVQHSIACAITTCGAIECWPSGAESGLSMPPSGSFRQITGGGTHACAIDSLDALHCWGEDSFGQADPPGGTFVFVSSGLEHSCAIASDGHVECWGAGSKLPNDTTDNFGQAIPPTGTFKYLAAGYYHTCGILTDGTVQCWGAGKTASNCTTLNECGQSIPPTGTFQQIAGGFTNTCGITTNGTLACWGSNTGGRSTPPADFK